MNKINVTDFMEAMQQQSVVTCRPSRLFVEKKKQNIATQATETKTMSTDTLKRLKRKQC